MLPAPDLAIKKVWPEKLTWPAVVANFQREAEVWVNQLGLNPRIVSCYYVRVLGGLPRFSGEVVDGGSLKDGIDSGRLYEGGHEQALERMPVRAGEQFPGQVLLMRPVIPRCL